MSMFEKSVRSWLHDTGIEINGPNPWEPKVYDSRVYTHTALYGHLGLGDSYVRRWWDCEDVPGFITRTFTTGADAHVDSTLMHRFLMAQSWLTNMQTSARNLLVGTKHYDLGNSLYASFLDSSMTYTCGFGWSAPGTTLASAQETKNRLVCHKAKLKPGMRVLDIGAGWGALDAMMAREYGVEVVGVTISDEQAAYVHQTYADLPIRHVNCDWRHMPREISGKFDAIVSVGMFEQVGRRNYRAFMELVRSMLTDDGLFVLHTIGGSGETDPWLHRHIFPNGQLPRQGDIETASHDIFVQEHWENFGDDYAHTLRAWRANFLANYHVLQTTNPAKYTDEFKRMFDYYLACCEGSFIARRNQLWQFVFSPNGVPGGYRVG